MKVLQILFVGLLSMFVAVPAMAIDYSACGNDFVYNNDPNVECIGRLELNDMGQFIDGVWQWHQTFLDDYNVNAYTQWGEGNNGIVGPVLNNNSGPVMTYGRLDNRAWAESRNREADSRFVFQGEMAESSGYLIPSIWMFSITNSGIDYDMATCPDGPFDPNVYVAFDDDVYTFGGDIDPETGLMYYDDEANFDCTPIYNGLVANDPNAEFPVNGYFMDTTTNDPGGTPIMLSEGSEVRTPITFADILNVEWVEGGQTRAPYYTENANYYYMGFDMGMNKIDSSGAFKYDPNNIYFFPFAGQVWEGTHTFIVNLVDGSSVTVDAEITSNTLMPVIAATTTETQLIELRKLGKSGKIMATEGQVEVQNLKAKTIIDDNGGEALLIQFAEPDRAMELINPNTRLRIWVAEPDMMHEWSVGDNYDIDFLWINAPLHTGSIVVPPDAWSAIKAKPDVADAGYVVVGGMYREQLPARPCAEHGMCWDFQYHNRGYIDSITVPIQ